MTKVIGVRFRTAGKIYFFAPGKFDIKQGDNVIVETARGVEAKNPSITCRHFDTKEELIRALPLLLTRGDSILVKASHFMEFPEIVEWLKEHGSM